MANEENLVPFTSEQSHEEAVKNGRKGGIASGIARRQSADIRKRLREIANMALTDGDVKDIKSLADAKGANLSISDALVVKLVTMALGGNIKAMNKVMELLGNDPTEAQETPQSVTSGFIDALNGTAAEVWADEAPKEE